MIYESDYFMYPQNLTLNNFEYINKYRFDFIPKLRTFLTSAGIESTFIDATEEGDQPISIYNSVDGWAAVRDKYGLPDWLNGNIYRPLMLYGYSAYLYNTNATNILLFTINDFQFALVCNSIGSDPRYSYALDGCVRCDLRVKYIGSDTTIETTDYKKLSYAIYGGRVSDEWNRYPEDDIRSSLFYPWGGGGCKFRLLKRDDAMLFQITTILNNGEKNNQERHLCEFGYTTLANNEKIILPTATIKSKRTNLSRTRDILLPMHTSDAYSKFHDVVGDRFVGKTPLYGIGIGESKYGYITDFTDIYEVRADTYLPYGIVSIDSETYLKVRLSGTSEKYIFDPSKVYIMRG